MGRVGTHFWGFETQGVVPDIVTMGKPIGNGHPLGAVVTTPDIARAFANGMEYFNTFGGKPGGVRGGSRCSRSSRRKGSRTTPGSVGAHLLEGLRGLVSPGTRSPATPAGCRPLSRARAGAGPDTLEPAGDEAAYVANRMREQGILVSTDGPFHNVLKIKPPLCFTRGDADRLVETLDHVLSADSLRLSADRMPEDPSALRRAIRLPHATAMVVGTIIGASIFVQPSEVTTGVPSVAGVLRVWLAGRRAHPHRRADHRRAGVGVPAHRRRVRLPHRGVRSLARLPLGLGDVLEHALGHHRRHRGGVRALRGFFVPLGTGGNRGGGDRRRSSLLSAINYSACGRAAGADLRSPPSSCWPSLLIVAMGFCSAAGCRSTSSAPAAATTGHPGAIS